MRTLRDNRRPPGCPQEVHDAIDVFTDGELETLFAEFSWETGKFLRVSFEGHDGRVCTFAEPKKAKAIAVLEKQYREEICAMMWAARKGLFARSCECPAYVDTISRRLIGPEGYTKEKSDAALCILQR